MTVVGNHQAIRRYRRRIVALFLAFSVVGLLTPAAAPHINNNFAAIIPGEVFRSAQPNPSHIRRYYAQYRIATIINLRGAKPGAAWYDEEIAIAKKLGIRHIDFPMSAHRELSPEASLQLLELMRSARKPLMIHCKAGADRTGLAASLYLAGIAGKDENTAESQLSLRYGHYSVPHIGA